MPEKRLTRRCITETACAVLCWLQAELGRQIHCSCKQAGLMQEPDEQWNAHGADGATSRLCVAKVALASLVQC
jgi:hypothetical protein